ncbi:MAG: cytidylate kinase-like family protein [Dehalococcoidia bacterium]
MPVITVSGNLGSGAREVARDVAQQLALDYVDQEILVEAARQLGVSLAAVERRDERARGIAERLALLMRTLMERSAAATDPLSGAGLDVVLAHTYGQAAGLPSGEEGELNEDRYLATLTSVIKGVAARGNVVILGRGSQAILRDQPDAFHVCIFAPKQQRILGLVQRDGMLPDDAKKRVKESDQNRVAFHQRFFKVDAESPALYDLTVNTAHIPPALAVDLIAIAVRGVSARPPGEHHDVPQP